MKKTLQHLIAFGFAISSISAFSQNGYFEDFSSNTIPSGFGNSSPFTVTVANKELKAVVNKGNFYNGLDIGFPSPINITSNPTLSFKIKVGSNTIKTDYRLTAFIFNSNGTNQTGLVGTVNPKIRVSDTYQTVSFRFKSSPVNLAAVTNMQILFNPTSGLNGTLYLDDIALGNGVTPAVARPYVTTYGEQVLPLGSSSRVLRFYDVIDGTTQTNNIAFTATSSNTILLPNPNLSFSNNSVANLGSTKLTINPAANMTGTSNVTVTLTAANSQPYSFVIPVTVSGNKAPEIAALKPQEGGSGMSNVINLTGINDGNPESEQSISITASCDNQAIIPNGNITVNYNSDFSYGTLNFTPAAFSALPFKSANITLTLKDNGGTALTGSDTKTLVIPVIVYPKYYNSPTIDFIIQNYNYTPTNAGNQNILLTGITDGNDGTNIGSITATSSNKTVAANPTIKYLSGSNTAILTYNALAKGLSNITINISNTGAPANSNGNTTTILTFSIGGIDPQYTGYVETFGASEIYGSDYYTETENKQIVSRKTWLAKMDSVPGKWYIEGQGTIQTLTLSNGKATIFQNKPNSVPQTFCGVWYSPRRLFDLNKNKYLSVTVSANPATDVTFDIFDINDRRYGLLPVQSINSTPKTLTFNFSTAPGDPNFDFNKIASILLNTTAFQSYNGTITITSMKIGGQADNAPAPAIPAVSMNLIGDRYVNVNSGPQTLKLTGIVDGKVDNNMPVSLQIISNNTNLVPTPTVTSVVNGIAVLNYQATAGQTGVATITVKGTSLGSTDGVFSFKVNVITPNSGNASTINITPTTKYQTIDGFGAFSSGPEGDATYSERYNRIMATAVNNLGLTVARNELAPEFELVNDNDDPNVLNLSGYNVGILAIKKFKEQYALGIRKFITTLWSAPAYMKLNLAPNAIETFFQDNRLDSNYTAEFAEHIVAYIKVVKQETGIDIFAISLQNELQFNEPTT